MKKTALTRNTPMRRTSFKFRASSGLKRTGVTKTRKASASTVIPDGIKAAIDDRDQHLGHRQCQRCGRLIGSGPFSRHHRDPRGMGGSKADPHAMVNLVLLCGTATTPGGCHAEVESHRLQAELDGWLVPMNIRPENWPARRFGREEYEQPGWAWHPAPPNPMQRTAEA